MKSRVPVLSLALALSAVPATGQQAAPARPERSHVERFASPRERAELAEREATEALRAAPSDVEALRRRGTARVNLGKLDGALADFRRASDLAPNDVDLHVSRGYVLAALNRRADAHASFERAIALNPDAFLAHYHLGRLLLVSGAELKRAAEHLERALTLRSDLTDIRFDLITVYRQLGDPALASAQLRYLRDERPNDPRVLYLEGQLAADRGDFVVAIERFQAALASNPRLKGAQEDLALALVRAGRWAEAEPLLAQLAAERPSTAAPAYLHALALFNLGRTAQAEYEARKLAERFPKTASMHAFLGVVLAAREAPPAELIEVFGKAVSLDPSNFDAQFYLGRAYYSALDRPRAAAALAAAVRLKPDHIQARFFLATALEESGKSDEALVEYEEIGRRAPESSEAFVGRGVVLGKRGQYDEAVALLRRSVELKPDLFEGHYALGRALARTGSLEDAVASLRRAVEIEPERSEAHYQLALALQRAGHADEAKIEFQTVERLNLKIRNTTDGMGSPTGRSNP